MLTVFKKLLAMPVALAGNGCFKVTRNGKLKLVGMMTFLLSVSSLTAFAQNCFPVSTEETVSKSYAKYPYKYHQQGHWLRTTENFENVDPLMLPEKMRRIFNDFPIYRDWKMMNVPFNKKAGDYQNRFNGSVSL